MRKTTKFALLPMAAALLATQVHAIDFGVNIHEGGGAATTNGQYASVMANRNLRQARMDWRSYANQSMLRDQIIQINAKGGKVQMVYHNGYEWQGNCGTNLASVEQDSYNQAYSTVSQFSDIVHDWEIFNEVQLDPYVTPEVAFGSQHTSTSGYAGKACVANRTAAIKGAARAVHDLGQRVIMGVLGPDYGWLTWLQQNGVTWDVTGTHIYQGYNSASLLTDTYYAPSGPFPALAAFGKPITINEFNCHEIYDSNYENTAGQPDTEQCMKAVSKHVQEIKANTSGTIESVVFYELLDEPSKSGAEGRFGLQYDLATPKVEMFLVSAFAGGNLTSSEQSAVTSRGLLTDAQIAAMKQATGTTSTSTSGSTSGTTTGTTSGTTTGTTSGSTTGTTSGTTGGTTTTADTTAPSVQITSPSNGASIQRGITFTVSASATDNVAVTKVNFVFNGSTCTKVAAPYSCSFALPNKPHGSYLVQASAYDAAGNVGSSSVTVNATR